MALKVTTLAVNNLPFRGHTNQKDVSKPASSDGNFMEIIKLLSHYDPVLEDLLKKPKGSITYLSPEVQNELINLIANHINEKIKEELNDTAFVAIISDSTQDISKIDQLSTIFRYVSIKKDENEKPVAIEIKESFCGFTKISDQSSEGLETVILKLIEKFTNINKLRGQGYDGAANMSGIYTGLQSRIRQKNSAATFVHCCAHNLNLVINDSVSSINEIRQFYEQLENIYVFFSSVRRFAMLMQENVNKENILKTLKRVCPTRWSSRIQELDALRSRYFDVLKLLTYLSLNGKNNSEKNEAKSILEYFEKFPTVILIIIQSKILEPMNVVSQLLQSSEQDMEKPVDMLCSMLTEFKCLRSNWELIKNDAIELAKKWDIQPYFPNKRVSRTKKFFDELSVDERTENHEDRFRVEVFNRVFDILINQLTVRFQSVQLIYNNFKCISPKFLVTSSDTNILAASELLVSTYPLDISGDCGSQLLRFKMCFISQLKKIKCIREVAKLLIIHADASSSFPDIVAACLIFLTLPVTTASGERSFSKLKLIKTYLRSTMSQERLIAFSAGRYRAI